MNGQGGPDLTTLSRAATDLLQALCLAEEDDRLQWIMRPLALLLWQEPPALNAAPSFDDALSELLQLRLVDIADPLIQGDEWRRYVVSVALAEDVRQRTAAERRARVLESLARSWMTQFARECEQHGPHLLRAGIAPSAYLRRAGRHQLAYEWLEQRAMPALRESSQFPYVLPHLFYVAIESGERALWCRFQQISAARSPDELDRLRSVADALAAGRHALPALAVRDRCYSALRYFGDASAALDLARLALHTVAEAGGDASMLGLWRSHELGALYAQGRHAEALSAVDAALASADRASAQRPAFGRWLREEILNNAAGAAKAQREWQLALDLNARLLVSVAERGGTSRERARFRFSDYASLLELGDAMGAEQLLLECQRELAGDDSMTGLIFGALGIVASRRGESAKSLGLRRKSLAAVYEGQNDLTQLAIAHEGYGNELSRQTEDFAEISCHWAAAALLYRLLGNQTAQRKVEAGLGTLWRSRAWEGRLTLSGLIAGVERTEGVHFSKALARSRQRSELAAAFAEVEAAFAEVEATLSPRSATGAITVTKERLPLAFASMDEFDEWVLARLKANPTEDKPAPTVEGALATLRERGASPRAIEAHWDGDTQGWFLRLCADCTKVANPTGSAFDVWLGTFSFGGDIRLFTGAIPPWPEAQHAARVGKELAAHFAVPFFFPSPAHPEEDCPRWRDRHLASPCSDCGILLLQQPSCPWHGRCSTCQRKQ